MFVYFVPLILLCVALYFQRRLFWPLALISMLMLAGLRFEIGDDYGSYRDAFYLLNDSNSLLDVIISGLTGFEIGFTTLLFVTNKIFGNVFWLFLIVSVFNTITFKIFFDRLSVNPPLSLLFYYGIIFISLHMAPMRQSIACSFIMLALVNHYQGKLREFFVLVFCATLFHYAAILFLTYPLYLAVCKTNRSRINALILGFGFIFFNLVLPAQFSPSRIFVSLIANSESLVSSLFSRLALSQTYLDLPGYASSKLGSPIFILYILFSIVVFWRLRTSKVNSSIELIAYNLFIHGFLVMAVFSNFSVLFDRIKNFNIPALGMIVAIISSRVRPKSYRLAINAITICISLVSLMYLLNANQIMYVPYYSYFDHLADNVEFGLWDQRWRMQYASQ